MANPTVAEVQHRRSGKTGMTAMQNAPTPAMRDMMREVFSGDKDPFDVIERWRHKWTTDKLHPKDWGETPPQVIYDTVYPLEYITTPCRQRPEIPEGVDAEWRRLTNDDGLVYWHRVG